MTSKPKHTLVGETIGGYRIEATIAAGGFGTVYRAVDESQRAVALKVLHEELASNRETVLRFQREVRMVNLIHHRNVVEIYDFGELDGGQPYFAMELLSGRTLRARLKEEGRMTPDEALSILGPLCSALSAAHEKGIVHRDLKASNVFLADCDQDLKVVLLDFGLAKLLDDTGPTLTASRHVVGTPPCMAPEQISGGQVDERADVYALGVLGFHMITGSLPFRHEHTAIIHYKHLHQPPPLPSRRAPVPLALDQLICATMAKDPAQRPQDVEEFLRRFREAARAEDGSRDATRQGARHSIAVYLDVAAEDEALEDLEDEMLDALENALPLAAQMLASCAMEVAMQSGNSLLAVAALPEPPEDQIARRNEVADAVLSLNRALAAHFGHDVRIRFGLCLNVGREPDLLRLSGWVPEEVPSGVTGHPDALSGLDVRTESEPDSAVLVRVLDA